MEKLLLYFEAYKKLNDYYKEELKKSNISDNDIEYIFLTEKIKKCETLLKGIADKIYNNPELVQFSDEILRELQEKEEEQGRVV